MKKMKFSFLAIGLLGVSSIANAGFEIEPNNSYSATTPMVLNEVFKGNLEKGYPDDYYKFTLTEPAQLVFHFRNTS